MKYNNIHSRYDLPLGLQFSIHFDKVEYPNKWITISNIPALDYFVYEGIKTKEEILQLIHYLLCMFGFLIIDDKINTLSDKKNLTEIQKDLYNKIIARYNNEIKT